MGLSVMDGGDGGEEEEAYGEEGVDDVCLDGAQGFVSDDDKDLLLLLEVDEITKPRLLGQSGGGVWSHDAGQLTVSRRENEKWTWNVCLCVSHSGDESGVKLDMSSWVGTARIKEELLAENNPK